MGPPPRQPPNNLTAQAAGKGALLSPLNVTSRGLPDASRPRTAIEARAAQPPTKNPTGPSMTSASPRFMSALRGGRVRLRHRRDLSPMPTARA
eukprot:6902578-Pyramimonas_sp.AAC.1